MLPQNQVVGQLTSAAFSGLQNLMAVDLPGKCLRMTIKQQQKYSILLICPGQISREAQ